MRAVLFVLFSLFIASYTSADTASVSIAKGLLPADIEEMLGEPIGTMQKGGRTLWLYPKGTVEFEEGRVVRSDIISDAAYAELQAKRAQEEAARREAAAAAPVQTTKKTSSKKAPPPSRPSAQTNDLSARFYRPFVRPEYQNVQYYNNIPIVFEIEKWPPAMSKSYDASVEIPESTGQRRTTYDTLLYELKKYPDEMLEQTLRCIYMIRNIRGSEENQDPAGLAFYTEGIILEHTSYLHHEYAHQLLYLFHDTFPRRDFAAVSGEYGSYQRGKGLYYKELWKRGFTSNYAMSGVHEDFSEFCSQLYLQPITLFAAMKENPKLQEKFDVVRPFLEMVKRRTTGDDSPMDEAYFSRFDRTRWKP
jgi:hypothetical protein